VGDPQPACHRKRGRGGRYNLRKQADRTPGSAAGGGGGGVTCKCDRKGRGKSHPKVSAVRGGLKGGKDLRHGGEESVKKALTSRERDCDRFTIHGEMPGGVANQKGIRVRRARGREMGRGIASNDGTIAADAAHGSAESVVAFAGREFSKEETISILGGLISKRGKEALYNESSKERMLFLIARVIRCCQTLAPLLMGGRG